MAKRVLRPEQQANTPTTWPSAVLLRPRGQQRGEVSQHPGIRRPLACRHPGRPSCCTLTSLPRCSAWRR